MAKKKVPHVTHTETLVGEHYEKTGEVVVAEREVEVPELEVMTSGTGGRTRVLPRLSIAIFKKIREIKKSEKYKGGLSFGQLREIAAGFAELGDHGEFKPKAEAPVDPKNPKENVPGSEPGSKPEKHPEEDHGKEEPNQKAAFNAKEAAALRTSFKLTDYNGDCVNGTWQVEKFEVLNSATVTVANVIEGKRTVDIAKKIQIQSSIPTTQILGPTVEGTTFTWGLRFAPVDHDVDVKISAKAETETVGNYVEIQGSSNHVMVKKLPSVDIP